jgi:hypothetical protein
MDWITTSYDHICNEHQWLEGQCDHQEDEHGKKLPILTMV